MRKGKFYFDNNRMCWRRGPAIATGREFLYLVLFFLGIAAILIAYWNMVL
jgi:hypothetical protein